MIYIAFMMGLLGSLHCLGMCGPIALALPVRTANPFLKFFRYLMYNSGRVLTYGVLGLVMGLVGKGFALAGLQQLISIAAGILIIAFAILVHNPVKYVLIAKISNPFKESIKSAFQYYFSARHWYSLFILGMLNGLLPCGMVYAALVGASATGDATDGAFFMMVFGLGTVPMMMAVSLSKHIMGIKMRAALRNTTPYIACIIGVLLILRGLSLDIPFVSPAVESGEVHKCH